MDNRRQLRDLNLNPLSNRKGFSLPEILVTLAIMGLTSLAAAAIVTWISSISSLVYEKSRAEQSLLDAAYRFKTILSLAVNVGNFGTAPGNLCTSASPAVPAGGCVTTLYNLPGSSVTLGTAQLNGKVDTLARFYREGGVTAGKLVETAIFFRRPDITNKYNDGTYPSGALYFVSVPPGSIIQMGPDDIVYDHFSNFSMSVSTLADPSTGSNRAKSATINLTTRYFTGGIQTNWMYCPLGTCSPNAGFKEQSLTITANFIDNVLRIGNTTAGDPHLLNTLFGNIYFMQTEMPR